MIRKILLTSATVCAMITSVAYANEETRNQEARRDTTQGVVEDVQTEAFRIFDKDTNTVEFNTGETTISEAQRTTLRSVVRATREGGAIEKVIIAAWSDRELPAEASKELSKQDRELAELRAENVKAVLDELGMTNVDVYNMAERSNWLARLFNTNDAQVKEGVRGGEVSDPEQRYLAEIMRSRGGAGKAVIIVQREPQGRS